MTLAARFAIKDVGDLSYFLEVEVILIDKGIFLSQHKYVQDLHEWTKMIGAKNNWTLLSTTTPLALHDGSGATAAATLHHTVIGALQYLSVLPMSPLQSTYCS